MWNIIGNLKKRLPELVSKFIEVARYKFNIQKSAVFLYTSNQRQWHPTPVLLPGESHGWRNLATVHGVARSWTWLSDFTCTFHFHALEKEMATHSSVLAWRIPGMGEPGGLPSLGSHRVGHNWSDLAAAMIFHLFFCLLWEESREP